MSIRPDHHWRFDEGQGNRAVDAVGGVPARLTNAAWRGHGRIGRAVTLDGRRSGSRIDFGNEVGRFRGEDFTVAFGMKILDLRGQKNLHVIGNRSTRSHGNFFSVRMKGGGRLTVEVDEDERGRNYAFLDSDRSLADGRWHHVSIVRQGRSLKLYIDGELSDEGRSKTGIADIGTEAGLSLGDRGLKGAVALYEDLRIYRRALDAADVMALVPPANRVLREGEIELIAADGAAVVLDRDEDDLSRFSTGFKVLRVGPDTRVTLYRDEDFEGTRQKCYADLPDIRHSRLAAFPKSLRIGSAVGEPFTGKWTLRAPNGRFLSVDGAVLGTSSERSFKALFGLRSSPGSDRIALVHSGARGRPSSSGKAPPSVSPGAPPVALFIDEAGQLDGRLLVTDEENERWLALGPDGTFDWTRRTEERAVFTRSARRAKHEGQVGELAPGEVALYEHVAYHGKTWILSDGDGTPPGEHARFGTFEGLNDRTSSVRPGPNTGATLFRHGDFRVTQGAREEEVEDLVDDAPDLRESQIGNDALSSIRIFRTVSAQDALASYTSKLSQDYRMVDGELEEFSAYRTVLRLKPGAGDIEISATDLITIEVGGASHRIDEQRSVTLSPNELDFVMITSEADGVDTPGLKIRTAAMARNERVVIFPNREAQRQIAELGADALWNATDAKGEPIVDREAHDRAEVASVQNTVSKVMGAVIYADDAPPARRGAVATRRVGRALDGGRARSSERSVAGARIGDPWELTLEPAARRGRPGATAATARAVDGERSRAADAADAARGPVREVAISRDEFARRLARSTPGRVVSGRIGGSPGAGGLAVGPRVGRLRLGIGNPFDDIKDAFEDATSATIGFFDDAVHVLVDTAGGLVDFVIDTAEAVAELVEAIVATVVSSIRQFIEFLQFLFGWEDILETQRYLIGAINAGFDFAAREAGALKTPLSAAMNGLQDTVEDGMNQLVTALGGEPTEARQSGFELPEAAEWFFVKLLGGSKADGAVTTPGASSGAGTASSGAGGLEGFAEHLNAAFGDVAGAALRQLEGMGETVATLITNPMQPQLAVITLVETLRDVLVQLLEALEQVGLGFLDLIAEAVEQLKNLLNAEIRIPFISDLFALIGGGKLTLLNLASLLLAIPTTVISKLLFGEAPFKGVAPVDFSPPVAARSGDGRKSGAPDGARPVAARATSSARAVGDDKGRERSIRGWGIAGLSVNALNGFINAALNTSSESSANERKLEGNAGFGLEFVSLALGGFGWMASFPSSPDFPGGRPYNVAAHGIPDDGQHEAERAERFMWGFRTFAYWLDATLLVSKGIQAASGGNPRLQSMRRSDATSIVLFTGFAFFDAWFTIVYLQAAAEEDEVGLEIANEIVSALPNLLPWMRLTGPKGAAALAAVDIVSAVVSTGLGGKVLADDLKAV